MLRKTARSTETYTQVTLAFGKLKSDTQKSIFRLNHTNKWTILSESI